MARMESKGPAEEAEDEVDPGMGVELRPRPPRRSPEATEEAWTCEAAKRLVGRVSQYIHVMAGWAGD